jgi:molybdopterin-guanine dinucleotide biosynthesis protein MobB
LIRIAAITGRSGSGKTTLIESMIRDATARGIRVAAIKHTHHTVNDERRGDTERFLAAGAEAVILAGEGRAVIFRSGATEWMEFGDVDELTQRLDHELILIEGFKSLHRWPRIELDGEHWLSKGEAWSILDRIDRR